MLLFRVWGLLDFGLRLLGRCSDCLGYLGVVFKVYRGLRFQFEV